jgi:hypothetical protein
MVVEMRIIDPAQKQAEQAQAKVTVVVQQESNASPPVAGSCSISPGCSCSR